MPAAQTPYSSHGQPAHSVVRSSGATRSRTALCKSAHGITSPDATPSTSATRASWSTTPFPYRRQPPELRDGQALQTVSDPTRTRIGVSGASRSVSTTPANAATKPSEYPMPRNPCTHSAWWAEISSARLSVDPMSRPPSVNPYRNRSSASTGVVRPCRGAGVRPCRGRPGGDAASAESVGIPAEVRASATASVRNCGGHSSAASRARAASGGAATG